MLTITINYATGYYENAIPQIMLNDIKEEYIKMKNQDFVTNFVKSIKNEAQKYNLDILRVERNQQASRDYLLINKTSLKKQYITNIANLCLNMLGERKNLKPTLDALQQLIHHEAYSFPQLERLLNTLSIPGITSISIKETTPSMTHQDTPCIHDNILAEIGFPQNDTPKAYQCCISLAVMDSPCHIPGTPENAEKSVLQKYLKNIKNDESPYLNPITRKNDLQTIESNADLKKAIALFIKKSQYLYYTFQNSAKLQTLYSQYKEQLTDNKLDYSDFCKNIVKDQPKKHSENALSLWHAPLTFFATGDIIPLSEIATLAKKYHMHKVYPSTQDYIQLLGQILTKGEVKDCALLLSNPILDVVIIDPYVKNSKGLNVLDYIRQGKEQTTDRTKKEDYDSCEQLLTERYPRPTQADTPSQCTLS